MTTPNMVPAGAFEAAIDALRVSYAGGAAELHTSPEFEMKRLLAEHRRSIYQIAKCYRDDPPETGVHLREFTMLEFYRMDGTYRDVIEDTKAIFEAAAGRSLSFAEIGVEEALKKTTGYTFATLPVASGDNWEEAFFKALIEKIEPSFDPARPTILKDYPAALCALGRIDPARGTTDRFEIYWKGMELCNGCAEFGDVAELEKRYLAESESRARQGKKAHPFPTRLAEAFEKGLPDCAGVAIGVDRLYWALTR